MTTRHKSNNNKENMGIGDGEEKGSKSAFVHRLMSK